MLVSNNLLLSPWLDELPYKWNKLETIGQAVTLNKDENIFHFNDPVDYIYLVKEGRVRLFLNSPFGDEKAIAIIGKNGLLGETSIYQQQTYIANAITASSSIVIKLKPNEFKEVILGNRAYSDQLLDMMSLKIRLLSQSSLQLAFFSSYQRICDMFIQLGLTYGRKQNDDQQIKITIPFTQQEVADLVGVSRVTVSNNIRRLIAEKIISKSGKYYTIENMLTLLNQLQIK